MATPNNRSKEAAWAAAWADLERREDALRVFVGCWIALSFIPCILMLAVGGFVLFITDSIDSQSLGLQIVLAVAIVMGVIGAPFLYRDTFRCPRCRRPFFILCWSLPPNRGSGRRCAHCGLPRNSAPSD